MGPPERLVTGAPMVRLRKTLLVSLVLLPVGLYAACDDDPPSAGPTNGSDASAGTDATTSGDGATDATSPKDDGGVVRGPASLDFDPSGNGDPISLLWHDATSTLYLADNRNNQIWTWTDADGFAKYATVPNDPAATDAGQTNLGQLVRLDDGTIVVPRFGFGQRGAIVYVNATTQDAGTIPGLPLNRRRVALAASGSGNDLWGGFFLQGGGTDDAGTITKITSLTNEELYAGGFQKPVSVIVLNNRLIVSEQTRGVLYSLPLTGATPPYDVYANIASPDTLAEGPNGSLVTGQFRPQSDGGPLQLRQIFPDGGVVVLEPTADLAKPQGVAYDKTNKRLFVADSNGTTVRTIKIFPLN